MAGEGLLIVSGSEKTTETLRGFLSAMYSRDEIFTAASGGEARRLQQAAWGVVVISTPLPDEFGDELAVLLSHKTGCNAVLLAKAEQADETAARVEEEGVLVMAKPITRQMLFSTVKHAQVTHRRLAQLEAKLRRQEKKNEELRLVGRAKCALIQYRDLTEPQAHHYIEREAMDSRITRKQVAEEILRTFEG